VAAVEVMILKKGDVRGGLVGDVEGKRALGGVYTISSISSSSSAFPAGVGIAWGRDAGGWGEEVEVDDCSRASLAAAIFCASLESGLDAEEGVSSGVEGVRVRKGVAVGVDVAEEMPAAA
jgi:hypothetical protein